MSLDPHTLLVVASFATIIMAITLVLLWASDRQESATLWMAVAMLLCVTSAVLREVLPETAAILVANVLLGFGLGAVATACRILGGRNVFWPGLLTAPMAWLLACAIPAFLASQQIRMVASSLSCAALMAWAVTELWRDRRERLWSRWGLIVILGVQGLATLGRAVGVALSHQVDQGVARTANLSRTTFWAFGFLLLIGFAMVFFIQERMQVQLRRYKTEDRLTGLANGSSFNDALDAAFGEAHGSGHPLAVLAIQADDVGMPRATDRAALRTIAQVIAATVAPMDGLAAHCGDGHFVVLLRGLHAADLLRTADAVRNSVRDAAIGQVEPGAGLVTVSIGYATLVPANGVEPRQLRTAAIRALGSAQRTGRDRVQRSAFPEGDDTLPHSTSEAWPA